MVDTSLPLGVGAMVLKSLCGLRLPVDVSGPFLSHVETLIASRRSSGPDCR